MLMIVPIAEAYQYSVMEAVVMKWHILKLSRYQWPKITAPGPIFPNTKPDCKASV